MKTLSEIKADVDRRAALIGATGQYSLPTYGHSADFARPHIEVDALGYHFVVVERGQERSRFTTRDLDELLYQIFQTVTFLLASSYELAHRVESQDCRRLIFQRQVELLSQLSPHWAEREAHEHERILREHPLDDLAGLRAGLTRQLREAGHPPETAWQMACEQYPLPVTFNPAWRTSSVVSLAQAIYNERRFSDMPILADALEDAGCTNADILQHCRLPGEHVRGCWVVDLILSKDR